MKFGTQVDDLKIGHGILFIEIVKPVGRTKKLYKQNRRGLHVEIIIKYDINFNNVGSSSLNNTGWHIHKLDTRLT